MNPIFLGFGVKPHAVILWHNDEKEPVTKTICYDQSDVDTALKRHTTPGDFYNTFTPVVYYESQLQIEQQETVA